MNEQNNGPFVTPGISVGPNDGNGSLREDDGIQSSAGSQIAISIDTADEPAAVPSESAAAPDADDPMQGTIAQINRLRDQAGGPSAPSVHSAPVNREPPSERKKHSVGTVVVWSLTFLLLVMAVLVFYLIAR